MPSHSRFIAQDPLYTHPNYINSVHLPSDIEFTNLYVYVANNPINYRDPEGLMIGLLKCYWYQYKIRDLQEKCKKECPSDVEGMIKFMMQYDTHSLDIAIMRCVERKSPGIHAKMLKACGKPPRPFPPKPGRI